MDFTFSEAQRADQQRLRRVLMTEVSPELLREMWADAVGTVQGLWPLLSGLGLTAWSVPAACGGRGGNDLDWALVAQELGYHALPLALTDTAWVGVAALGALHDTGFAAPWLSRIASGAARVAIGQPGQALVADAQGADLLLLHRLGEWHALAPDQVQWRRNASIDASRQLFHLDWTPRAGSRVAEGGHARALADAVLNRGAVSVALHSLGLAMRLLDLAIDHSAQRKQFGKPIGAFQAVKHALADVALKIEFAKPVVYQAVYALQHGDVHTATCVSHARLAAAEAARTAARQAMQVHGAAGYAWDGDVQIYLKRTWAIDNAWGSRALHQARVAEAVLRDGAALGARNTFDMG